MCWLVRGAAAVGSRDFGSRGPTGAIPAAGSGSGVLRGFPQVPAGFGGAPAAALSSPRGAVGGRGRGAAAAMAGMVFGERGSAFVGMLGELTSRSSPGSRRAGPFVCSCCRPARGWHLGTNSRAVPSFPAHPIPVSPACSGCLRQPGAGTARLWRFPPRAGESSASG